MVLSMEFEIDLGISDAIPGHWMVFLMDFGFVGYLDLLMQPHGVRRFFVWNAGRSLDVSVDFGWVNDAHLILLYHSMPVLWPMAAWDAYGGARWLTAWCQRWYQWACVGPNITFLLYIYNGIAWHNSVLFQVHVIDTKTDF